MDNVNRGEKAVFAAARELTNPEQRRAFLDQACFGDPEMRHRLEEMLTEQTEAELMARKLRVQYPGAIHRLINRRDRREPIFYKDKDRSLFLSLRNCLCRLPLEQWFSALDRV